MTRNNNKNKKSTFAQAVVVGKPDKVEKGDDNNSSFTVVSYKKKPHAARSNDTVASTATSTNGRSSTSMNGKSSFSPLHTRGSTTNTNILVTLSTIGTFHFHVYPIIQQILKSPDYQTHPFMVKWRNIMNQGEPKISGTSSFHSITKRLSLNPMDVMGYHHFIKSCPTIEDHVVIMDSAMANAFNYHMNPGHHRTPLSVDKPSAA
jgi:hypothetical protein